MSVRAENRWKARTIAEFHATTTTQREAEVLARAPSVRAPVPYTPPPVASKREVRRWMRLHAHEYDTCTELAEACNCALPLPDEAMEPDGWAWDLALEEKTGMDWSRP
jgi:hypothetical protein